MENVGRVILKGLFCEEWVKIQYHNKKDEETHYMIGINDIDPYKKKIYCDGFNVNYGYDVKRLEISYDSILTASICEGTYHKTPQELIKKIEENKEEFIFLNVMEHSEDILDYYSNCFKLDAVPYVTKYRLVEEIDIAELEKNYIYNLNEKQFKILSDHAFYQEENKQKKKEKGLDKIKIQLAVNNISIYTDKGLYVLAYQDVLLDIENKCLIASKEVHINKEFCFDGDKNEVKYIENIHKYLPEDDYYLLDNIKENQQKIMDSIREYNDTRKSSYHSEVKTESRPFLMKMARKLVVDIDSEFDGIRHMIRNPKTMSFPIKAFFGEINLKFKRALNYPIFTIDDRYNIDQINAINIGLKSPVSYIQGPPGTGKTQTLVNAILSSVFNGKTVLVTSNNNIPIDGVYEDINGLHYNSEQMLFPAIRLGSFENCGIAIDRIKMMYEKAKGLSPDDSRIKSLKKQRSEAMKGLMELLSKYEKYTKLLEKEEALTKLLKDDNSLLSITLQAQLNDVRENIKSLGDFEVEKLKDYVQIDQRQLRMALHYETAARLQALSTPKHKDLYEIINLPVESADEYSERTRRFRLYLSNDENLQKFLEIFPVVLATNLSCTYLGKPRVQFDIVMMDEAGQCNVSSSLIPIVRGKQLLLVGDPQQLCPVVVLDETVNRSLKLKYRVANEYDYLNNSIYTLLTQIDLSGNETLLSYHYRCHDKIIGFSNQKYYHNKLKLCANSKEQKPLQFIDTTKKDVLRNLGKKNISEYEAKSICEYIKQNPELSIGIITPFVHQKECIEYYLKQNNIGDISVGTVHRFQGDQKDVILFSTAITNSTLSGTYNWLKKNKELINVAVSRAKSRLVILGNLDALNKLSDGKDDLKELCDYVKSNGESLVTDVSIESVALGTRQMNRESEKHLTETVEHVLSVLKNGQYFTLNQVPVSSLFNKEKVDDGIFYKQTFDLVIFEHTFSGDRAVLAIELDGPEHREDESVVRRDKKKDEICKNHNFTLLRIPRDCARDYLNIKDTLKDVLNIKKSADIIKES